ncbi:MAG: lysylphosphatidylglycerol synthase transmembrane domain-containing protein [Methylocystis sp.]|jgi:hypothetical protein
MKKLAEHFWPLVGLAAVLGSFYLLYHEFRGESVGTEVWANLQAIPASDYFLAALSTLLAYAALAWYDRIALLHLGVRHISWIFISICSFTTYALSHNIGASVFSGAMVRYRAYSSKGLTATQVAALVVLCSYTFAFGNILLGGLLLTYDPGMMQRLAGFLPDIFTNPHAASTVGLLCLAFVAVYIVGSLMHFKPFRLGRFEITYPRPEIMLRQLFAAPAELIGAAGIIYFALPEQGNPGFIVVLGTFLLSFSAALVSHAPGGLGIFELLFINLMPDVPRLQVLAALLVWRLFYLIIPLLAALVVVGLFERRKFVDKFRGQSGELEGPPSG